LFLRLPFRNPVDSFSILKIGGRGKENLVIREKDGASGSEKG
jgi:hypothetical protein